VLCKLKMVSWQFGLAHLYPALEWSLDAPGHHGYPRAPDLIPGKALKGQSGRQIPGAPARPFLHLLNPARSPRRVLQVPFAQGINSSIPYGIATLIPESPATMQEEPKPVHLTLLLPGAGHRKDGLEPARSTRCVRAYWQGLWPKHCDVTAAQLPQAKARSCVSSNWQAARAQPVPLV
jgi:hypothetical protein